MKTSAETNEIAAALAKAQNLIEGAKKDSSNPFFKSKYADLASVIEAIRAPFALNNLSYIQGTRMTESGNLVLITRLSHASGQYYESEWPIRAEKEGIQALGSAVTYVRRYSLSAMAGVAQVDDDGEAAMSRGQNQSFQKRTPQVTNVKAPYKPATQAPGPGLQKTAQNLTGKAYMESLDPL